MLRIVSATVFLLVVLSGCKVKDPLYCDESTPCSDPARPYCDLNGEYPASEGIKRTCIPDPLLSDGGPDNRDGNPGDDGASGRRVVELITAGSAGTSCAVLSDGGIRCWGQLHFGGEPIGDNEHPREVGDVETGGPVAQVAIGGDHICIRYEAGGVRCWGENAYGQLGYGHTDPINTPPAELPDVQLGGPATAIAAGSSFTCAVLEGDEVRCWGRNLGGQLGYGHTDDIGDNEVPTDQEEPVDIGGGVLDISSGAGFSCAVLTGGGVRCWGVAMNGRLGYGTSEENIGDNESPAEAGFVNVGGGAEAISVDTQHACVLLNSGAIRCWGAPTAIGIPGNNEPIGDDEAPASVDPIDIGGDARQIVSGQNFNCAVREDDQVVCWGNSSFGDLGYGDDENIGDNEAPAAAGPVMLGEDVNRLSVGSASRFHSCALLASEAVRCWGYNDDGELGLGYIIDSVGDDETPASKDPVQILD